MTVEMMPKTEQNSENVLKVIYSRTRTDHQNKVIETKSHDADATKHEVARFIPSMTKRLEYAGALNVSLNERKHMKILIATFKEFTEKHSMIIVS